MVLEEKEENLLNSYMKSINMQKKDHKTKETKMDNPNDYHHLSSGYKVGKDVEIFFGVNGQKKSKNTQAVLGIESK